MTDSNGNPLGGICVNVVEVGGSANSGNVTASDGSYEVGPGLPTGNYTVYFSAGRNCDDNLGNYAFQYYDNAPTAATATDVPVTAGVTTTGINAVMTTGGSIEGSVTAAADDADLQGICVHASETGSTMTWFTSTASDGTYEIDALNTGTYSVEFFSPSTPNDCGASGGTYAPQWYAGETSQGSADPVSVTAGEATTDIDGSLVAQGLTAPTIGTATAGNGSATVTFTAPVFDGGSPITGYKVTAADLTNPANGGETVSGPDSPLTVSGLTNGDSYTFTVTATNANGTGPASSPSNAVGPAAPTPPPAPTIGTATPGNASATVTFTAPTFDGGGPIQGYSVVATDLTSAARGGQVSSGSGSPLAVSGLTNGDSYTFTVTATNALGTGPASSPSNAVTPLAAPPPVSTPTPAAPAQHGYWLVGSDGGIFSFGSAQFYGSTGAMKLQRPVVGITPTATHAGYWLVASDGGIFAFGDAQFYGSVPGLGLAPAGSTSPKRLNAPIVGMVPTADGGGYFMVASDGGVFTFGDAKFEGSCPGIGGCSGAAVAVAPDASGNGYWLVTATGHVYAFGDAVYHGAPGPQSVPVTSAVRTTDGGGYWILFSDGVVDAYGDAANMGGPVGAVGGSNPATTTFTTSDGGGYWVASANGDVFPYGDAPDDEGMAGVHLNGSIIAATGW